MSANVDDVVDAAIMTALSAIPSVGTLAPGGIHNTIRRQSSSFPAIVFQYVGGPPEDPRYGQRDGCEYLSYDVKVIAPDSTQADVGGLITAVHDALQGVPMTLAGLDWLATMRTARIRRYPETLNGVTYVHRGATYTITVSHPA